MGRPRAYPFVERDFLLQCLGEGLTDAEIAARLGCPQGVVFRDRTRLGVPARERSWRSHLPDLNADLRSLLVGSLLGDGCIRGTRNGEKAFFAESHAEDQHEYLLWKAELWGSWLSGPPAYSSRVNSKIPCQPAWGFRTIPHVDFLPWERMFYPDPPSPRRRKRFLASDVLPHMSPLALAVWFMDDGTAGYWPTITVGPRNKEQTLLLLRGMGFDSALVLGSGVCVSGQTEAARFRDMILPHVHPTLLHKTDSACFRNAPLHCRITVEEVLTLFREGLTVVSMARRLGVGKAVVRARLQEAGVPEPVRWKEALPKLHEVVRREPRQGQPGRPRVVVDPDVLRGMVDLAYSIRQMGAVLGVSDNVVARLLNTHGIPHSRRRGGSQPRDHK